MLAVYMISVLPAPFSPTCSISAMIWMLERRRPTRAFTPAPEPYRPPFSPASIQDYWTALRRDCQYIREFRDERKQRLQLEQAPVPVEDGDAPEQRHDRADGQERPVGDEVLAA